MFRAVRVSAAVVLIALAGACMQIRAQVTRFHHMPPAGNGETFVVLPFKDQAGSLEWEQYADLIAQQLTAKGYVRVTQPTETKYAVLFAYTIDRGKTTEVPIFGQTGGGVTTFSGNTSGTVGGTSYSGVSSGTAYTPPTYGLIGSVPVTRFTRAVTLYIIDEPQSMAFGVPVKTFEATAGSVGSSGALAVVMPAMIAAIFKDFPGKSGETITVSVPSQR
jgi:hypothetical protein